MPLTGKLDVSVTANKHFWVQFWTTGCYLRTVHTSLSHRVKPGQVYHLAFPKWTTKYELEPHENWGEAVSVFQTLDGTDIHFRPATHCVSVPTGTIALVLKNPGEGKHVEAVVDANGHPPDREVLCLVTTPDERSFEAVVSVLSLWKENPKSEYPPTLEEQGVDPNWKPPPTPEVAPRDEDPHLNRCVFLRMIDRTPLEELEKRLNQSFTLRHLPFYKGQKFTKDTCRIGIEMIRCKRKLMKATTEERAKYRLDE